MIFYERQKEPQSDHENFPNKFPYKFVQARISIDMEVFNFRAAWKWKLTSEIFRPISALRKIQK